LFLALGGVIGFVGFWVGLGFVCRGVFCEAMDGDLPIFFDRHHISAHGDRMLRRFFDESFSAWFLAP
jgi:hypothetical protein